MPEDGGRRTVASEHVGDGGSGPGNLPIICAADDSVDVIDGQSTVLMLHFGSVDRMGQPHDRHSPCPTAHVRRRGRGRIEGQSRCLHPDGPCTGVQSSRHRWPVDVSLFDASCYL